MKAYIARRAFLAVPTLIGVSLFTFLIMAVIPGDIAYSILGKAATAEAIEAVREKLGLDDPWYVRYGRWMKDTLSLDLGHTGTSQAMMASNFHEPEPIRDLLVDRLPVTLNPDYQCHSSFGRVGHIPGYGKRYQAEYLGGLYSPGSSVSSVFRYRCSGWA